ncbi:MAG: hypothetical protein JXL85_06365 [Bacilli bacterium]|nr:hypothetical protein [Bacilli bacterium]
MSKLMKILPFIETDELKELAIKVINGEVKGVSLKMIFPFLPNEELDEIIDQLIEKNDSANLKYSIPFLSKKKLGVVFAAVKEGKVTGLEEHYFYPFLGQDQLKEMFRDLVKTASEESNSETEEED